MIITAESRHSFTACARAVDRDAVARLRGNGEELVFIAAGRYDASAGSLMPVPIPDSLAEWSGAWVSKSEADAAIRRAIKVCDANAIIICRDAWISQIVGVQIGRASCREKSVMAIAQI